MSKKKKVITSKKPSWRNTENDGWIRSFSLRTDPESLCPTTSTIHRAISGDLTARIVIDSYAFRFPVTVIEVLPCE